MQKMGMFYLNNPFWSCSVWYYHSYQFYCYISIQKKLYELVLKKKKEEGCFKLEWKDFIIFKILGKNEIKLYYDNFESVFF